jgi:hypothetical protein
METTKTAVTLPGEDLVEYLTVKEAAGLIGMSVTELTRLATAFQVPALWCLVDGADAPEPVFPLRLARRIAEQQTKADDETRPLVLPFFNLVRAYVAERAPTAVHEEAFRYGRPFLARAGSKWGDVHAHVRPDSVALFAAESDADVRLRSSRVAGRMLPLIHAKEIAGGLRDGNGIRVSRTWWRLPLSVTEGVLGGDQS